MLRFSWLIVLILLVPAAGLESRPEGLTIAAVASGAESERLPLERWTPAEGTFRLYDGSSFVEFQVEKGADGRLRIQKLPLERLEFFARGRKMTLDAPANARFFVPDRDVDGRPFWENAALSPEPVQGLAGLPLVREVAPNPDGTLTVYPTWTALYAVRPGTFLPATVEQPARGKPPLRLWPRPRYGLLSYPGATLFLGALGLGLIVLFWRRSQRDRARARAAQSQAELVERAASTWKGTGPQRLEGSHGTYLLMDKLGSGGMGTVYRATCLETGELCAVKQLHEESWEDPELRERFRREIVICNGLHHPGLVSILDWGERFLVCELVEGQDLRHRLSGPIEAGQAVAWACEILQVLRVTHEHGVVHRDLKPENIMVTARGRLKLMDFGIAGRLDRHTLTRTATAIGTPAYMSPEHLDAKRVTPASDLYSVGILLYEMLTGRPPFQEEDLMALLVKILTTDVPPIKTLRPDLPPALTAIVDRLLERDPEQRYRSAAEVLADLEPLSSS